MLQCPIQLSITQMLEIYIYLRNWLKIQVDNLTGQPKCKQLSRIMKSDMITLNKESTLHDGEDLIPMGLESVKAKESNIALSNCLASNNSLRFGSLKVK